VALRRRASRATNEKATAIVNALRTRRALTTGGASRNVIARYAGISAEARGLGGQQAEAGGVVLASKGVIGDIAAVGAMTVSLLQGRPTLPTAPTPLGAGKGLCCVSKTHTEERGAQHA
jgi:hypothetical protein